MSSQLVSRSHDLQRLVDEGYGVRIQGGHLLLEHIPYLESDGTVAHGVLISELNVSGDETQPPSPHTAHFTGIPHEGPGREMDLIIHSVVDQEMVGGLRVRTYLSSKPPSGQYSDYYAKMTQYAKVISAPARAVDETATARTHAPVIVDEGPFRYIDSASGRAGTAALADRLAGGPVAIIGLGGTGSYILDQVAKTPVPQIHLWDADVFHAHNAFRAPGAASLEQLNAAPRKVDYLAEIYARMHRGLIPHPVYVDAANVAELTGMSFVFIAMDASPVKQVIIHALQSAQTPFIDVGVGLAVRGDRLAGMARVTSGFPGRHEHLEKAITYVDEGENEYDRNIQVAELNMLNAALAVIRWKKYAGFYADGVGEAHSTYTVAGNMLTSSFGQS
ncbi:ThiF family adenylyltransferase [Gryllotalpicola koreensis]|uniref:ThiF family adenylyltransferase n=1 Tax=Gryllotalpicola koreensis TaxID=993086 RepID=A0ABP7ZQK4_9MICO